MKIRTLPMLVLLALSLSLHSCASPGAATGASVRPPKLILIIGDGMDDQQITIARNYLAGNNGRLDLDRLPYRGAVQIQAVAENNPAAAVYVSDSANTATSIATGVITSTGRIATSAGSDEPLQTIMELAQAAGMGTGIVTTSSLTDATPSSFIAHINIRACQGPTDMVSTVMRAGAERQINCSQYSKRNGGGGSISEQLAASNVDILLGGGSQYFDQAAEGTADTMVLDEAMENGYQVVRNREQLLAARTNDKLLGIFSRNHMPVALRGEDDARAVRLEKLGNQVQLPAAFSCESNPQFSGMPTLEEMTRSALSRLDQRRGFMLMIESASIDKQSHARRPCGSIGELGQLNAALVLAMEYASTHPETLVLVTADHAHAAQIVSPSGVGPGPNFASPGYFARLRTPEGSLMGINYATNDSASESHTGAQVPIYGFGSGVESLPAFIRQTEIFHIMANHLGLDH